MSRRYEELLKNTREEGECRIWVGSFDPRKGAPLFYQNRRKFQARRVVYEAERGIPDGHQIHLTCGNRRCINIKHLVARTKPIYCKRGLHRMDVTGRIGRKKRGTRCATCRRAVLYFGEDPLPRTHPGSNARKTNP